MKALLLISIVLFSVSAYGQKASKKKKSKEKTEVNTVDQKYTELIKIADAAFAQKDYSKAREHYVQALALKPTEAYAKSMLDKTQNLIDQKAYVGDEEMYAKVIAAADKCFAEKNYLKAKDYYKRASLLKPSDPYPKAKLAEVEVLLNEQQVNKEKSDTKTALSAVDQEYAELIKIADAAFAQKDYARAKENYTQALSINLKDSDVMDKLNQIDAILDEAQMKPYKDNIVAADRAYEEKKYLKAKDCYERALMIRPNDPYPKNKLAEVEALLKGQQAKEEKTRHINQLIKEGDELFASKQYTEANIKFNQALVLDATAMYPKQKITEIQSILAPSDTQTQFKKIKCDSIIQVADVLFTNEKYNEAKAKYYEALVYHSLNKHCLERINEINRICETDGCSGDQKKMEYEKTITEADTYFKLKDYQNAKKQYIKAAEINAGAAYPKQQIYEIEQIQASINAEKARMEAYNELIAKADKLLLSKQYAEAKNVYSEAVVLKADASYPKQKITEIEKILSETEK